MNNVWLPMPSYLLRQWCISKMLKSVKPAEFLEIGSGAGGMLVFLGKKGWKGLGVEISEEAVKVSRENIKRAGLAKDIRVAGGDSNDSADKFRLVMAFEVLEHVKDDARMLKEMCAKVKKGGYLIISVPARMSKWSRNDVFAGHYRRYEKKELIGMISASGFKIIGIWSYGFPLANFVQKFRSFLVPFTKQWRLNTKNKTKQSGISYPLPALLLPLALPVAKILTCPAAMYPWYIIQRLFFNNNLGVGYVLLAQKASATY